MRGCRNKWNRNAINGKNPETKQLIALSQILDRYSHHSTKLSRHEHCDSQIENVTAQHKLLESLNMSNSGDRSLAMSLIFLRMTPGSLI